MSESSPKSLSERALEYHAAQPPGKTGMVLTKQAMTADDLSLAYSPGVASPCLQIEKDPASVYRYTNKGNLVGVISNGTAVLGLGNIGPHASKPVMEGRRCCLRNLPVLTLLILKLTHRRQKFLLKRWLAYRPLLARLIWKTSALPNVFLLNTGCGGGWIFPSCTMTSMARR